MNKCWRNHSLSIVLGAVGITLMTIAVFLDQGKLFDVLLSLGSALLTVVLFYMCAGKLREVNKPEEPPK